MKYEDQNIDELLDDIEKLLGDEPKKSVSGKKAVHPIGQQVKKAGSGNQQKKHVAAEPAKGTASRKKASPASSKRRKAHKKASKAARQPKQPSVMKRFAADLKRYLPYSFVSAKAKLKSEVANSYLNWIWWILEPLCFMLIYAFVFGYVFKAREQSFAVFIFVGLTLWNFFDKTIKGSVKIVKNNKSIVSKVYFPKFILILTKMWVNGFKMLLSFGIVIVMLFIFKTPISWNVLYAVPILLTLFLLTFGCSCYLLHYGVYVEDLSNIISLVSRMLLYMTGIFYNLETRVPEYGALLNRYNPMAFLLSSMRQCLLYTQEPDALMLAVWFAVSLLLAVMGVRKIYKEENSYVKAI